MNAPFTPVIQRVLLRTANATRLAEFYQKALGLLPHSDTSDVQSLSLRHPVTGHVLLTLIEAKDAQPAPPEAPGLFHIAFLFAQVDDWLAAVRRSLPLTPSFHGASDHGVSWAAYLEDPDGNGLELAWDKPSREWSWQGDQIQMVSLALPLRSLLQQSGPELKTIGDFSIGHLHLQVADLRVAKTYQQHLDLRVTQSNYPGALFMARGQYHHHLAINTWRTRANVSRPENAIGFIGWDMTTRAKATATEWQEPTGALVTLEAARL